MQCDIIFCSDLFSLHRKQLIPLLKDNAAVLLFANPIIPANGDNLYPYEPNSNVIFFTGIAQAHTRLLMVKKKDKLEEWLFIQRPDKEREIWDGKLMRADGAAHLSGISKVHYTDEWDDMLPRILHNVDYIYLDSNENDRRISKGFFAENASIEAVKKDFPLHAYERLAPLMKILRMKKTHYEIQLIQQAIDITQAAFLDILRNVKHLHNEREIHALIYAAFVRNGATQGFPSIVACGDNARILHYTENDQHLQKGELILIDFGARKNFYNADITRTIPYQGKFTARQKELYNGCLHLQTYAKSLLKPGVNLTEYTRKVGEEAGKVFLQLGLLNEEDIRNEDAQNPAYRKYLYHGISHHLGLDVHDLAYMDAPLEAGMVLTVEPGIYVAEENIGIRLENDVLITEDGCIDLAADIPITAESIEHLIH